MFPFVAGVLCFFVGVTPLPADGSSIRVLDQERHLAINDTGLFAWLRLSRIGKPIDSVRNTGETFLRIDALGAPRAAQTHLEQRLLDTRQPLRKQD